MPNALTVLQRLQKLEEENTDANLWLAPCAISKDNLSEWTSDLFLYTENQFSWVLPRLLAVFICDKDLVNSPGSCLFELVRFLDAEKSPADFPGEEDDWPDGALSKSKKERFSRLNREQASAILDWLCIMRDCVSDMHLAKEVDSATKFWRKRS